MTNKADYEHLKRNTDCLFAENAECDEITIKAAI